MGRMSSAVGKKAVWATVEGEKVDWETLVRREQGYTVQGGLRIKRAALRYDDSNSHLL